LNNFYKTTILNTQIKKLKDQAYRRSLLSHGLGSVFKTATTPTLILTSQTEIARTNKHRTLQLKTNFEFGK
jgi:hypothetical protein